MRRPPRPPARRAEPGPGGLPAVAVSLTGPSLAQARTQARSAIDAGADVLELRVDLLEEEDVETAPDDRRMDSESDAQRNDDQKNDHGKQAVRFGLLESVHGNHGNGRREMVTGVALCIAAGVPVIAVNAL